MCAIFTMCVNLCRSMHDLCTTEHSAAEFCGTARGTSHSNFEYCFERNLRACVAQEKTQVEISGAAAGPGQAEGILERSDHTMAGSSSYLWCSGSTRTGPSSHSEFPDKTEASSGSHFERSGGNEAFPSSVLVADRMPADPYRKYGEIIDEDESFHQKLSGESFSKLL